MDTQRHHDELRHFVERQTGQVRVERLNLVVRDAIVINHAAQNICLRVCKLALVQTSELLLEEFAFSRVPWLNERIASLERVLFQSQRCFQLLALLLDCTLLPDVATVTGQPKPNRWLQRARQGMVDIAHRVSTRA